MAGSGTGIRVARDGAFAMGLSREQRVELARDLFLFRVEIAHEMWAERECVLRSLDDANGVLPSEATLWGE